MPSIRLEVLPRLLLCGLLALGGAVSVSVSAAEKLFNFGDLNVDLSKVQAKPATAPGQPAPPAQAPVKESPAEQLPSTPESPAPVVLPRDGQESINATVRTQSVTVKPVEIRPDRPGQQAILYPVPENRAVIEVKIAAGSEKKDWLEEAARRFMADPARNSLDGKPIRLTIDKIGSTESATLLIEGKTMHGGRNEYQVWAPASSIFRGLVEDAFSGGKLFETDESIARSPMVFVTWEPVQTAIDRVIQKSMSFDTLTEIFAREFTGETIDPNGRNFQFGFTRPQDSNSGAVALIAMAYEFFAKDRGRYKIRLDDLKNPDFQAYLAFIKYMSDQTKDSTGKLAEPLMQAGYGGQPLSSVYLYENLAVKLAFVRKVNDPNGARPLIRYPKYNLVSDHPYYSLRHGNSREQVEAARRFKDYLLTRDMQLLALQKEGFRPVSAEISNQEMNEVLGDFVAENGLVPDLIKASQILIPAQSGEVIMALIRTYEQLGDPVGPNF
ncbi:substrate-binding domain-containing protein [uncultured Thiocystis sp.]|uniref:substrate-binding domain-containing protein n=1 Tax=uncultured Thiocystis sp. TaxID=1202134 RepID=UPI0025E43BD7|nr:substrate-binding domain-containing protein [uncultured Thiocystis sp.]